MRYADKQLILQIIGLFDNVFFWGIIRFVVRSGNF